MALTTNLISNEEVFQLYYTLNGFLWLIYILTIIFAIFHNICKDWRITLLKPIKDRLVSHVYTITIIASDPSPAYDYDNSSIKIDLSDKNDELIASLLMRPLSAFHSIQPKPNQVLTEKTSKDQQKDSSRQFNINNISRSVPFIAIYKIVSNEKLKKVRSVMIGHNCEHPNASILIRCLDITNIRSLVSHTYPLNAYVRQLSDRFSVSFDVSNQELEFNESEDMPREHIDMSKNQLNLIEGSSFRLLCLNIILFFSYLLSGLYVYNSEENWKMWLKAVPISLGVGTSSSIFYMILTLPYRLHKQYYVFKRTKAIILFQRIYISFGTLKIYIT